MTCLWRSSRSKMMKKRTWTMPQSRSPRVKVKRISKANNKETITTRTTKMISQFCIDKVSEYFAASTFESNNYTTFGYSHVNWKYSLRRVHQILNHLFIINRYQYPRFPIQTCSTVFPKFLSFWEGIPPYFLMVLIYL